MLRIQTPRKKLNEQGFASIVIALVLILVVALLTIGFAQLARREQQNALNKQLSQQAMYAAESGLNDAYKDIVAGKLTSAIATDSNQCLTTVNASYGLRTIPINQDFATANSDVDQAHGVLYSCLLVNLTPNNLTFDDIPTGSGQHATFSTSSPLNTMTIQWGSADGANNFPASLNPGSEFVPQASWHNVSGNHYAPVVAFSITPLAPNTDRNTLINNTFNVYLYPATSPGGGSTCSVNVNGTTQSSQCISIASQQGTVVSGACDTGRSGNYPCSVTLTGLSGSTYLIHSSAMYSNSLPNVYVSGNTTSGAAVNFTGEPQVDVTGKAKDVVKRIRARFLTNGSTGGAQDTYILPGSAIEAQDLCKRLQTEPLNTTFNPSGAPCDLEQHNP